jgi:hypothetical protein
LLISQENAFSPTPDLLVDLEGTLLFLALVCVILAKVLSMDTHNCCLLHQLFRLLKSIKSREEAKIINQRQKSEKLTTACLVQIEQKVSESDYVFLPFLVSATFQVFGHLKVETTIRSAWIMT